MLPLGLLRKIPLPASIPDAAANVLRDGDDIDRRKNEHSQFEQDAFDRSGKRSHALFSAAGASTPVATAGLPSGVQEDNSARTHEEASQLLTTAGSAVRQVATVGLPAVAALGATLTMRGGGGGGGGGGTGVEKAKA